MVKFFAILLLSAAALFAQSGAPLVVSADSLTPLQQAAGTKGEEWETLARGLEVKIGRMLPCDPRVRAAIEEVNKASEARLSTMAQYLKVAVALAKQDSEAAKAAVSSQDDGNQDLETERAEAEQEIIAVEGQRGNLADSVRRLAALEPAAKQLTEIAAMIGERAGRTRQQAENRNPMTVPLKNVLAAYQARQAALEEEQVALAVETSRWSEYYTARLARAQTECSIINQTLGRKK